MSEKNKAIARRLVDEVWNKGNLMIADEILAFDLRDWDAARLSYDASDPEAGQGLEGFKQLVKMFRNAFPDVYLTIDDMIAEGDRVVIRWTARGTHKGDLKGIAPTGRPIVVTGIDIHRIADGKILETGGNWDTAGMMQQLGAGAQI
jgi:steroid delta-isomerase-like uncharacterized protein